MSSIYIQEPPTCGKVLMKTSVGDIDVELWSRECPKACRNFVQLCLEGYYNNTIFHRVVKGFIAQGGDPSGDGSGGESIYGAPFKDEFHSRLRFARRGLLAMANSDRDDNGSQFFFTLGATPELQNKHTLFGKVTGDTVFNMLKLEEGLVDHNERPLYPPKILKTEVLSNPFPDIIVREGREVKETKKEKQKIKEKGIKNFGLLSFGEEAEEDEEETNKFVQKIAGRAKSTHDVLEDPKLSKETLKIAKPENTSDVEEYANDQENPDDAKESAERIKKKLNSLSHVPKKEKSDQVDEESDSDDDFLNELEKEKKANREKAADEIRKEIVSLKRSYKEEKKAKNMLLEKQFEKEAEQTVANELMQEYMDEKEKYSYLKEKVPKKGSTREEFTLKLLSKFKNKLETLKDKRSDVEYEDNSEDVIESDIKGDDWLSHKLSFEQSMPTLAKDASTKSDDWYDVFDPRNPLNKRKRGEAISRLETKIAKK